ncbi:SDR family NAD(P)-dependent oxidoreductase [Burkholderia sp. MSMB1459WGS]|uniref:SDR family NAD(P)-dependent oxidoreductase n=1 Tax=Burkholderia sp. MSMB1459WGS TaxID=1637970 RepID=UPI0012E33D1B|nr:SDR family oxidoreductase [Burkholderia sp. MSMB1459WGS]
MAKAAIDTLTHTLAIELGPRGIAANAVAPGFTRTDANAAFRENPERVKAAEAQIALGRFGEPSEIAAVVAFLASDDGHWVPARRSRRTATCGNDRTRPRADLSCLQHGRIDFARGQPEFRHAGAMVRRAEI